MTSVKDNDNASGSMHANHGGRNVKFFEKFSVFYSLVATVLRCALFPSQ